MPAYISLMVPGTLALFAAVVGVVWVLIERRQPRALEDKRLIANRKSAMT
jgi:hypothetical protein